MMDKLKHFALCLIVTFCLGWEIGSTVGVTIELTQAEAQSSPLKRYFWDQLFRKDTAFDLIADALGIAIGQFLRSKIL